MMLQEFREGVWDEWFLDHETCKRQIDKLLGAAGLEWAKFRFWEGNAGEKKRDGKAVRMGS